MHLKLFFFWKLLCYNCSFLKFHQFIYWAVHFIIDSCCRCPIGGGVGRPAPAPGGLPFWPDEASPAAPHLWVVHAPKEAPPATHFLSPMDQHVLYAVQWLASSSCDLYSIFSDLIHCFTWRLCIRSVFCIFKTFYQLLPNISFFIPSHFVYFVLPVCFTWHFCILSLFCVLKIVLPAFTKYFVFYRIPFCVFCFTGLFYMTSLYPFLILFF